VAIFSKRPFFTPVVILVCLLGAMNYAQNPPQSPLTADDFNQFTWRWIGPMTFSGRITGFAVPRGQSTKYYVLTATSGVWKTEDAGISFEPIFEKGGTLSTGWMAIAPSDPNILYLGTGEPMHARSSTHGNGVWKSTDAGKAWTKAGLEKSFFINKVEIDSKNPDIVYVAAEGKLYDNEMDSERGLFKSTDGGKTWTNLGPMKDRGVADFVIDPRNSDVIIAASYKLIRRAWTYIDRQPGNELFKSTDGGKTWKKLTTGLPQGVALGRTGLATFEKNPNIVYARVDEEVNLGFQERDGVANFAAPGGFGGRGGGAVFQPDSSFAQFKAFKMDPQFVKLAGAKHTPITAEDQADLVKKLNEAIGDKDFLTKNAIDLAKFVPASRKAFAANEATMKALDELEKLMKKPAAAADSTEAKVRSQITNRLVLETLYSGALANLQPQKRSGVVYRSDDQGETWKAMTEYKLSGGSTQVNQTEGGYYGRIIIDPNDDKIVYCGDTNTTVSKDSGKTFAVTGWDGTGKTHVDHRVVWVDPLNPAHILSGNDGAVSETWNGGKNWSQKNQIRAQQFYDVAVDQDQPYNVMGGTQDNGAWIGPSQNRNQYGMFAANWRYLPTGDGFYVVRDWWNQEYIYYESQFGASSRQNLNTGETSPLAVRLTPEQVAAGEPALRYQWNAPIVLSPHNPGIVYIANQYVWRSLSRGAPGTFQKISPDLTKASKERIALSRKTNLQWATIYSFAESPKKPGLYWVGTDDGNVQVSTDSGGTWTNITSQFYDAAGKPKPGIKGDLIPFDRWVKRVVPSAFDENTAYVAFSGYRTHGEDRTWLVVTKDLGKTWTDISGGMNNPLFDVEEDPDNANVIYLGTDNGIWVTVDQGRTWTAFTTSQPTMVIRDLAIQRRDREMAIGSYARGFFVADIAPMREFKPEVFEKAAHLFQPQAAIKWNRFERRGETLGEMVRALNPPIGATIYYYLKTDAQKVTVTIKDLEGTTVNEFTPTAKKGLQKAFWNLNRQAPPGAPVQAGGRAGAAGAEPGGGGRGGRGGSQVDAGVFKVTLTVDGKEVDTKRLTVSPDPLFK
jgi:photosystem II stability/assembly factor-like uncharacterized protein